MRKVPFGSGVLQPRQVCVLTANFIKPPTVGAATLIVLVWSPATTVNSISISYTYIVNLLSHVKSVQRFLKGVSKVDSQDNIGYQAEYYSQGRKWDLQIF
jgi:hypothetical protein